MVDLLMLDSTYSKSHICPDFHSHPPKRHRHPRSRTPE